MTAPPNNPFLSTEADVAAFKAFGGVAPDAKFVHLNRWYLHIAAFNAAEQTRWPAAGDAAAVNSGAAAAAPAKAVAADDDDGLDFDDDDLFGDDDDDDAEAAKEAMRSAALKAALARNKAKGKIDKSLIVFEVKPFEVETDLEALAKNIKAVKLDGLQNWGQEHKLVPVAYGIKKLIISCVVEDEKVGMDDIIDIITERWEDDVQSVDVQSMSKV